MNDASTKGALTHIAAEYSARGWHIIPVHGLRADGSCTCKLGARCPDKLKGKHPVHGKWQAVGVMSGADIQATWSAEAGGDPDWNIGVLTGVTTQAPPFFVLDVDPDADGLAELARLTAEHGELPRTRTHRTGSGGRHYLYLVPAGMTIRNNQRRIAPGIDIRGTGGMVVAPPSVSGKGAYEVVDDAELVPAPDWLIDLLAVPEGFDLAPAIPAEDLPVWDDLAPDDQERVSRFALAGLAGAVRDYENAPPGRGNDQLYRSACAALELAQSPWNLLTMADVVRELDAARERRITVMGNGRGQSPEEFRQTVTSARNGVVGQGRPLPPDPHAGLGLTGAEVDAYLERRAAAALERRPETIAPEVDPVDALLAKMLDRDALDRIPPTRPLIRDVLDMDSESWIIGAPGGFKSFVALDWAGHVATGLMWRGKPVTQGRVIYVVAEGRKGIPQRVRAWEKVYEKRMDGVVFLPEPVQVADLAGRTATVSPGWRALVGACRRLEPVLVVLDTQARITVGLEENSATAMGVLIEAIRALKEATGACVLVVHHTGRDGGDARGSSALDGAQDTEIRVERPVKKAERAALTATISMDKQKDGDESADFPIQLRVVDLGMDPVTGRTISSLAIEPHDPFVQPVRPEPDHLLNLTENQTDLLASIREHGIPGYGVTAASLRRWTKERTGRDIPDGSAGTALRALVKKGLIYRMGAQYFLDDPDAD